jgi:large repetitive protein
MRCDQADHQWYSTGEDTVLTVNAPGVLANDSDADGNQLSAVLGSGPSHGTLTLNPDGSFLYTPTANYNGPDSFTYRASDGTATSSLATVTLTVTAVNDAPR